MDRLFKYVPLCFIWLFIGCQVKGLTSGFNSLNGKEKSRVIPIENNSDQNPLVHIILKINAEQLQHLLKKEEKSLVYIWTPYCKGPTCLPLKVHAQYAKQNGLKLFVIADSYNEIFDDATYNTKFVIDNMYYHSKLRQQYRIRFVKDLCPRLEKKQLYNNHFLFSKDSLVASSLTLENLISNQ